MPPTPILTAEYLFRKAFHDAFAALMTAYTDSAGRCKCYWKRADQVDASGHAVTPPYLIYQPQAPIMATRWVNGIDAEGLFTIRALATSQSAAETLLGVAVPAGGVSLSANGYMFSARYEFSPAIPPLDDIWTVAHVFRISISTI
jgi:hypothetical protein